MLEAARDLAISHFYWKPAVALFRALELDAYLRSGHRASAPCLDLGCGDGSVSQMLLDAGVIDRPAVGLDLSRSRLHQAFALGLHRGLVRSDANALPFRAGAFRSVVCNGVLEALPAGPERAIREAARVLRPGGKFLLTVPTDRFVANMFWPRALARVSKRLGDAYVRRFDTRLDHHGPYLSAQAWKRHLDASGFELLEERAFLSAPSGAAYNLLMMHAWRPLRLLKPWGPKPPGAVRRILARTIERLDRKDVQADAEGGYVLFVARRR